MSAPEFPRQAQHALQYLPPQYAPAEQYAAPRAPDVLAGLPDSDIDLALPTYQLVQHFSILQGVHLQTNQHANETDTRGQSAEDFYREYNDYRARLLQEIQSAKTAFSQYRLSLHTCGFYQALNDYMAELNTRHQEHRSIRQDIRDVSNHITALQQQIGTYEALEAEETEDPILIDGRIPTSADFLTAKDPAALQYVDQVLQYNGHPSTHRQRPRVTREFTSGTREFESTGERHARKDQNRRDVEARDKSRMRLGSLYMDDSRMFATTGELTDRGQQLIMTYKSVAANMEALRQAIENACMKDINLSPLDWFSQNYPGRPFPNFPSLQEWQIVQAQLDSSLKAQQLSQAERAAAVVASRRPAIQQNHAPAPAPPKNEPEVPPHLQLVVPGVYNPAFRPTPPELVLPPFSKYKK